MFKEDLLLLEVGHRTHVVHLDVVGQLSKPGLPSLKQTWDVLKQEKKISF